MSMSIWNTVHKTRDGVERYQVAGGSMFQSFLSLPAEIQDFILQEIYHDYKSSIALSATCNHLRKLMGPNVFRQVRLRNDQKSGLSIQSMAKGPLAVCVEELHFQGILRLDLEQSRLEIKQYAVDEDVVTSEIKRAAIESGDYSTEESFLHDKYLFPDILDTVLSRLDLFKNLSLLNVEFLYLLQTPDGYARWYPEYHFSRSFDLGRGRVPGFHQMQKDESKSASKSLIARTWAAIVKNKSQIKHLELCNLDIVQSSVCFSRSWTQFTRNIRSLTLNVRNTTKFTSNYDLQTLPRRQAFVPKDISAHSPVGVFKRRTVAVEWVSGLFHNADGYIHQALSPQWQLSNLRHLQLHGIALSPHSCHQLLHGQKDLRHLSMHHTFSACITLAHRSPGMSIYEFFRILISLPQNRLTSLDISWTRSADRNAEGEPISRILHIMAESEQDKLHGCELDVQEFHFDCGCVRWRLGSSFANNAPGTALSLVSALIQLNRERGECSTDGVLASQACSEPVVLHEFEPDCRESLQNHVANGKNWNPFQPWHYEDPVGLQCLFCTQYKNPMFAFQFRCLSPSIARQVAHPPQPG